MQLGILVDPYREELTCIRPDAPPVTLRSGAIDLVPVLPGLTTTVEQVLGWLR